MNDIYQVSNPFYFITFFSDSFLFRKMGGEFLEGFSYFGTELSVGLDHLLFIIFFLLFFRFFLNIGSFFVLNGRNN